MTTNEDESMAARFEAERERLRGVAYRMLGSLSGAEDAVQEAWLNVTRSGAGGVDNLSGWLTTVVARVCLDMLRARKSRREAPIEDAPADRAAAIDPEREALLADSVGLALLVVLDALAPAERVAFVLHDLFGASFEEIGAIVGRSPVAARQLASRARRRVQGADADGADRARHRDVVNAFLAALRAGDVEGIVAVLDPDVVVRGAAGGRGEIRGARTWAKGAIAFAALGRDLRAASIDGDPGLVLAPQGRLERAIRFVVRGGTIAEVEIILDPKRLDAIEVALLE